VSTSTEFVVVLLVVASVLMALVFAMALLFGAIEVGTLTYYKVVMRLHRRRRRIARDRDFPRARRIP